MVDVYLEIERLGIKLLLKLLPGLRLTLSQLFKFIDYSLNSQDIAPTQVVAFFKTILPDPSLNLVEFILSCGLYNMLFKL